MSIQEQRYHLSIIEIGTEKPWHYWSSAQPFGAFHAGDALTVPGMDTPQIIKRVDHILEITPDHKTLTHATTLFI